MTITAPSPSCSSPSVATVSRIRGLDIVVVTTMVWWFISVSDAVGCFASGKWNLGGAPIFSLHASGRRGLSPAGLSGRLQRAPVIHRGHGKTMTLTEVVAAEMAVCKKTSGDFDSTINQQGL